MAEYRDRYEELRRLGVEVAALSVDPPGASERLRSELRLPFPILCDPERRVIACWGLLNSREHGGVAYIAYNALPAWQGALGMQRLLFEAGVRNSGRSDRQVAAGWEVVREESTKVSVRVPTG